MKKTLQTEERAMKIVIVDGQGGRLGKLLVEGVKARLPLSLIHI